MNLICVIMGAESKEERNNEARALLDFGFSSIALYHSPALLLEKIPVAKSSMESIWVKEKEFSMLIRKGKEKSIEKVYEIAPDCQAPIKIGDVLGTVKYYLDGECIGMSEIVADESANELHFGEMMRLIIETLISGKKGE